MKLPPVEEERVTWMLEVVTSRVSAREEVAIVSVVVGERSEMNSPVPKVRWAAWAGRAIVETKRAREPNNTKRHRSERGRVECFDDEFMEER